MKLTDFVQRFVTEQVIHNGTGAKVAIMAAADVARQLHDQGYVFEPEDAVLDYYRGQDAIELIKRCVAEGTTKHGMAGECLLLNEHVTQALKDFK